MHSHRKDAAAFICAVCRQTFMVNSKPPQLYLHVQQKHPGAAPTECFPVELKDFDPNDPEKKAAAAAAGSGAVPVKPKKVPPKDAGLDDLLNAGLAPKKGKN
jgi:Zinc-binding